MRGWWKAWQQARRDRVLRKRAIPEPLWQLTLLRYPFLATLEPAAATELRELATLFLNEKEFHGAGGLEVSDEMAVAIAAQACLPILRLGLHWYDAFKGIVVHADATRSSGVVSQAGDVNTRPRRSHVRTPITGTISAQSESRYWTRSFS